MTALRFSSLARPSTVALRAENAPAAVEPVPAGATPVPVAPRDRQNEASLERLAAYDRERRIAELALGAAERAGFGRLLREHREAWAGRWQAAEVVVEGDHPELQRAVRFALFHLMASVHDRDAAAFGARGLSGPYSGHVFWDSDVFVLPFLAATHPPAGRAMLEYRIRRLPAARQAARALGLTSAQDGWSVEASPDHWEVVPT